MNDEIRLTMHQTFKMEMNKRQMELKRKRMEEARLASEYPEFVSRTKALSTDNIIF